MGDGGEAGAAGWDPRWRGPRRAMRPPATTTQAVTENATCAAHGGTAGVVGAFPHAGVGLVSQVPEIPGADARRDRQCAPPAPPSQPRTAALNSRFQR
jgi:hypothetical protein